MMHAYCVCSLISFTAAVCVQACTQTMHYFIINFQAALRLKLSKTHPRLPPWPTIGLTPDPPRGGTPYPSRVRGRSLGNNKSRGCPVLRGVRLRVISCWCECFTTWSQASLVWFCAKTIYNWTAAAITHNTDNASVKVQKTHLLKFKPNNASMSVTFQIAIAKIPKWVTAVVYIHCEVLLYSVHSP